MGQCELVQPMGESDAGDLDPEVVGDREVRQPQPARRVLLRKVDLALGPVHSAPLPHAPLQRTQHAAIVLNRMTALKLLKQRHRAQLRIGLQQRDDLRLRDLGERILTCAPAARRPL